MNWIKPKLISFGFLLLKLIAFFPFALLIGFIQFFVHEMGLPNIVSIILLLVSGIVGLVLLGNIWSSIDENKREFVNNRIIKEKASEKKRPSSKIKIDNKQNRSKIISKKTTNTFQIYTSCINFFRTNYLIIIIVILSIVFLLSLFDISIIDFFDEKPKKRKGRTL